MKLNLGFSTAETRPIMAVSATIYLQFSYMQLINFILYICNVYYRILFLNSVKGNSKDTFDIFVTIFSG